MKRKFYTTKSKSGHYSITAKERGYSVTIGKLGTLQHARLAKADVGIALDKLMEDMMPRDTFKSEYKPGTFGYANDYHNHMTRSTPQKDETQEVARARRDAYRGYDDDGLPCD